MSLIRPPPPLLPRRLSSTAHSLEEIDVGEFLHLLDIPFRFNDFFIVEQHPRLAFVVGCRDLFADEGDVVAARRRIGFGSWLVLSLGAVGCEEVWGEKWVEGGVGIS